MFVAASKNELSLNDNQLARLGFDARHDFLLDADFDGIVMQLEFASKRYFSDDTRGVRRKVSVTLVDATERVPVAQKYISVAMSATQSHQAKYMVFSMAEAGFRNGHTYRVIVRDDTAGSLLEESVIHTFSTEVLEHPCLWFDVTGGGIRPDWEPFSIYRSVKVESGKELNVRFNLTHNFGVNVPAILPELEVRLYNPEGEPTLVRFIEPKFVECREGSMYVEMPFFSSSLYRGPYYAELLCMQYPIAGFVFSTRGPEVKGESYGANIVPFDEYSQEAAVDRFRKFAESVEDSEKELETEDFDELLDSFIRNEQAALADVPDVEENADDDGEAEVLKEEPQAASGEHRSIVDSLSMLTGLTSVKNKLGKYEKLVTFNKMRAENGLPVGNVPLHAMFLGSPGTGKTTVARRVGLMLRRAGVLSKGHVVVRERATLLGQNYSSESENTLKAIEEAQGGILLIDEAYQLFQPNDPRDPGKFVIESLLTVLADESRRDWMLILAGYPDRMRRMFEMNPGLKSRIPDSNIYEFEDFTESELMEIAERYFERNGFSLSADARDALAQRLRADYSHRDSSFGNARHVINMILTDIVPAMAERVIEGGEIDKTRLTEIQACDIPARQSSVNTSSRRRVGFSA